MSAGPGRRGAASAVRASACLALGALVLLGAASCAAPIRVGAEADPLALLSPGLAAYARIGGSEARRLLPAMIPPEQASTLRPLLERTRAAAIGLGPADAAGSRLLEAALVGDYPFRRASLALAADRGWKREGRAYLHAATGLRALVAGPGLVLASSISVDPLIDRAADPGPGPIPARLASLAGRELVLWMPDPLARLAPGLFGEGDPAMPVRGLFVAASPAADGDYSATVAFLMSDAEAARSFRPALRLAWYFIARGALGDEAGPALGARFALDGELVTASGVSLPASAVARLLASAAPKK